MDPDAIEGNSKRSPFPTLNGRLMGYAGLALYESVVPGMPGFQSVAGTQLPNQSRQKYFLCAPPRVAVM